MYVGKSKHYKFCICTIKECNALEFLLSRQKKHTCTCTISLTQIVYRTKGSLQDNIAFSIYFVQGIIFGASFFYKDYFYLNVESVKNYLIFGFGLHFM